MVHKDLLVQNLKDDYILIPMIYYNFLSYLGNFQREKTHKFRSLEPSVKVCFMKFRHALPTYTYHSGKVVSMKNSFNSDPRKFFPQMFSSIIIIYLHIHTYLELPYPFESYSIGIDVLAERGIPADALVAAVLARVCSVDG